MTGFSRHPLGRRGRELGAGTVGARRDDREEQLVGAVVAADPPARHQLDLRFGDAIAGAALKKVYDTVVRHRGDDRRSDGGPPRRAPRTWCADPPPGGTRSARSPGAVALVLHFGQDRDLLQAAGLQPLDRAERTGRYRVDTPASRGSPRAAPGHARCHGRSARSRRELGVRRVWGLDQRARPRGGGTSQGAPTSSLGESPAARRDLSRRAVTVDSGGAGRGGAHEMPHAYDRSPGITAGPPDYCRPARPAATYDR